MKTEKMRTIKRKQVNFRVSEDQAELIEKTITGLKIRDSHLYTIKDSILTLCDEFLNSTYPDKEGNEH